MEPAIARNSAAISLKRWRLYAMGCRAVAIDPLTGKSDYPFNVRLYYSTQPGVARKIKTADCNHDPFITAEAVIISSEREKKGSARVKTGVYHDMILACLRASHMQESSAQFLIIDISMEVDESRRIPLILHEVHFGMIVSFVRQRRTPVRRVETKGNSAQKERALWIKAQANSFTLW